MAKKKEILGIIPFIEVVRGDDKVGFKDLDGNVVVKAKYEVYGTDTEMIGGLATFVQGSNSLWGIINNNARLVVEKAFHTAVYEEGVGVYRALPETRINKEAVNAYDLCGMIDNEGNVMLPCAFDAIKRIKKGYFYLAKGQAEYGIYRITDDKTVSLHFDMKSAGYEPLNVEKSFGDANIYRTAGGDRLLEVKKDGLSGVIKVDGTEVVPCNYQTFKRFGPAYIIGRANDMVFSIKLDDPENVIIEPYNS